MHDDDDDDIHDDYDDNNNNFGITLVTISEVNHYTRDFKKYSLH